jgi:hypothetical protein
MRARWPWLVGLVLLASAALHDGAVGRRADMPMVVLWAWERPEDLRFIDPDAVGVAYLDRTVTLRGAAVDVRLRQQPLRVPSDTHMVAVVRIEADPTAGREADPLRVAAAIAPAAGRSRVRALQLDFDAVSSQRVLYRRVLHELRRTLPSQLPLSMTALASWCAGDPWLDQLPVDEVVPMLFEMGADDRTIAARLREGEWFGARPCHGAIGVSTRERLRQLPAFDRAYVFNHRSWTRADVVSAIAGVTP